MNDIWKKYKDINNILKKDFLCIPPYRSVNGMFMTECLNSINKGESLYSQIAWSIRNPGQRAYQMEYRFKKAGIFHSYIPVIEYATYDALQGNWICAYLSLLPVVEALFRKWADEIPSLTFYKMPSFSIKFSNYLKENLKVFDDEREALVDGYIEFLQYMTTEVLYIHFDSYNDAEFKDVFNRNLALHKLEGVVDFEIGLRNVTRILLLIDVIAELYLLQTPENWWDITFSANPEENWDFQLRWQLYIKRSMLSVGPNDLLIIQNAFLEPSCDEEHKKAMTKKLKQDIESIKKNG